MYQDDEDYPTLLFALRGAGTAEFTLDEIPLILNVIQVTVTPAGDPESDAETVRGSPDPLKHAPVSSFTRAGYLQSNN